MNSVAPEPRKKETAEPRTTESEPETVTQRQGGDDALAEQNPLDARLDEKVIVNEQSQQKIVNSPSQTEAHPTEGGERVDEIQ